MSTGWNRFNNTPLREFIINLLGNEYWLELVLQAITIQPVL